MLARCERMFVLLRREYCTKRLRLFDMTGIDGAACALLGVELGRFCVSGL
jgi:hypothetical protein